MKRWCLMADGKMYICSLLDMSPSPQSCTLFSDCGERLSVLFDNGKKYQFAMAKNGNYVDVTFRCPETADMIKGKLIFR